MLIGQRQISFPQRLDFARIAFAAARANGISPCDWRKWRKAKPERVLLMAFDPLGELARMKERRCDD